jgi:cbb3-type cytochrome oxidase subunit 3
MERPLGITILGAGMILAGLGFAAAAVFIFFVGSTGAAAAAPESSALAALLAALSAAGGIIFLLFGALHVVLAIAIFQLRNVARILTIFLFLLVAAGACLGLIATLMSYSHVALLWNFTILALDLLALWYLLRPQTKEVFSHAARG